MKNLIIPLSIVVSMLFLPLSIAEPPQQIGPILEVGLETTIAPSFDYGGIQLYVENIGDTPAHNITLTDFYMDGHVIYNNRGVFWFSDKEEVLEPGQRAGGYPLTSIIGLGKFTATMTVSCDEGITATGSGTGLILGFIIFVP